VYLDQARRSGKVRYWLAYRENGKLIRRSIAKLGLNPYSLEDAKDAEARRRVDLRENRSIFNEKPETHITLNRLGDWYLGLESVKILASYSIIKIKIKQFNKVFGHRVVADIKPEDLRNYQITRQRQGRAPGTVDQDIGKVKAMIHKAADNEVISGQVIGTFRRVKKTLKKGSDVRNRILSSTEFEALKKCATEHIKGIITMGYCTGMRKGEILNLTWDKVKLDERLIELEPEDTKDREARKIPICVELYNLLYSMPNRIQASGRNNHVFQYRAKAVKDIRKGIKDACKKAGIKYGRSIKGGFVFHDLRHTFNTNMRKAGVSESVIMKITGHSTREMFDRYNTVDESDSHQAIDQFESFLLDVHQTFTKTNNKVEIINNKLT
jgi:integrase